MKNELNLSGVILAGGESKRMGRDKAWLEVEGQPLLGVAAGKMRQLGIKEVFISGHAGEDYAGLGLPVLLDRQPGRGPLGGIERALHECTSSLLLVLPVDLPHMTPAFLRKLLARCDRRTGVVPRLRGRFEPLAAVYPRRCHTIAFEVLTNSRRAVSEFARACVRERAVRGFRVGLQDASCFANWNTPADVR